MKTKLFGYREFQFVIYYKHSDWLLTICVPSADEQSEVSDRVDVPVYGALELTVPMFESDSQILYFEIGDIINEDVLLLGFVLKDEGEKEEILGITTSLQNLKSSKCTPHWKRMTCEALLIDQSSTDVFWSEESTALALKVSRHCIFSYSN